MTQMEKEREIVQKEEREGASRHIVLYYSRYR